MDEKIKMSEKILIEDLRRDAKMRVDTDRILSPLWILLPLIGITVAIVTAAFTAATFAFYRWERWATGPQFPRWEGEFPFTMPAWIGGFFALGAVGVVAMILYAYLIYSLVKRRNGHFYREWMLVEDLISMVRSVASRKEREVEVPLSSVRRTLRDMRMSEAEKNPVLWVILLFVPGASIIASLYILYFLTVDFYRHERREDGLLEDLGKAMAIIETPISIRRTKPIPERSYILYLILTIVTLGIFGIYWLYTLIVDPNNHFQEHINLEDTIIDQLATTI